MKILLPEMQDECSPLIIDSTDSDKFPRYCVIRNGEMSLCHESFETPIHIDEPQGMDNVVSIAHKWIMKGEYP